MVSEPKMLVHKMPLLGLACEFCCSSCGKRWRVLQSRAGDAAQVSTDVHPTKSGSMENSQVPPSVSSVDKIKLLRLTPFVDWTLLGSLSIPSSQL